MQLSHVNSILGDVEKQRASDRAKYRAFLNAEELDSGQAVEFKRVIASIGRSDAQVRMDVSAVHNIKLLQAEIADALSPANAKLVADMKIALGEFDEDTQQWLSERNNERNTIANPLAALERRIHVATFDRSNQLGNMLKEHPGLVDGNVAPTPDPTAGLEVARSGKIV